MAFYRTIYALSVLLVLFSVVQDGGRVQGRSVEGFGRLEKLLSAMSPPAQDTPALTPFLSQHSMDKRQAFDRSCKGVYDRDLLQKLERVCDDCYNLYRKPYVAVGCKANCYGNQIFRQCITDLLLEDVVEEYARAVQTVGKKK